MTTNMAARVLPMSDEYLSVLVPLPADGKEALTKAVDDAKAAKTAARLAAAFLAERKQPAEARIGRPAGRIDEDGHAISEIEAAAHDQAHARCLGGLMGGKFAAAAGGLKFKEAQTSMLVADARSGDVSVLWRLLAFVGS